MRVLNVVDDAQPAPLREAAAQGRAAFTEAFLTAVGANPGLGKFAVRVVRDTGTRPARRAFRCGGAVGLAQKTAMTYSGRGAPGRPRGR